MILEISSPKFEGKKDIKRVKALVKNGNSFVARDLNLKSIKSEKNIGVLFSWSNSGLRFYDGVLVFDENKKPYKIVHCIKSVSEDWAISEEELRGLKSLDEKIELLRNDGVGIVWNKKRDRARFYLSKDFENVSVLFEAVRAGANTRDDIEKFLVEYPLAKHPSFYEGVLVCKPIELFLNDISKALGLEEFAIKRWREL